MANTPVPLKILAGFLAGVVVGVGGARASEKVADLGLGNDPFEKVVIVDKSRPIAVTPVLNIERLETNTGVDWGLELRQDRGEMHGGSPFASDTEYRKRLEQVVTVPDLKANQVQGVITNVLDKEATERSGVLYVVWFGSYPKARDWLQLDTPVFTDPALEAARKTYWAGQYVVYYAKPANGTDRSTRVHRWVEEVSQCPNDANPCKIVKVG
ncbi:hypothetical protein [Janibacter sp. G1551]|uniref:hypothetical protein n=1 Tax=Janibacter sp. G1551 TaxID=3420440 RepID=UPI003D03CB49